MIGAELLSEVARIRIVPVVVIDNPTRARQLAVSLRDAGIATAEVALRTGSALEAISEMANVAGFTVGAGTVLSPADAEAAIDAGARYLVSPGLDILSVARATGRGVPFIPGVASATEVQQAHALGLRHVKLFPAGEIGGRRLIDAFAGPFPDMRFLPSGGLSIANAAEYLASPAVFAVSGSWMVPTGAVSAGDFDAVKQLSLAAIQAISSERVA